jgi:hypothetical protein
MGGRYIYCPFFKYQEKNTISCEDRIKVFKCKKSRIEHLQNFCDSAKGWQDCPHAIWLNNKYEFERTR